MKRYYVYIMASRSRTLYTGVTNDLHRRVYQHKQRLIEGFATKYNARRLVHYEVTSNVRAAIAREKQIKDWLRAKKIALIEGFNPTWQDLSAEWFTEERPSAAAARADASPCHAQFLVTSRSHRQ